MQFKCPSPTAISWQLIHQGQLHLAADVPRRDPSTGGGQDSQETGKARKKPYKKNHQGCQYHYYIRMSHLRQDLWIQDRTIQPPENSPLSQKWTSSSASMDNYKQASMCVCMYVCGCVGTHVCLCLCLCVCVCIGMPMA